MTPSFVIGPGGRRLEVLTGHQEIHVVADVAWAIETYVRTSGDEALPRRRRRRGDRRVRALLPEPGGRDARGLEIHDVIGPDELHEQVQEQRIHQLRWRRGRCAAQPTWPMPATRPPSPTSPSGGAMRPTGWSILRTEDGLIEEHEGFMSLPLPVPPDERAGRDELAWQRDRMEWRDVKQADIVMLMALLEPQFDAAERAASYRLYEPLTRHLSSLSEAVHSLVARRSGMDDEADDYLRRAMAIDLEDSRGNRAEGLHMATQGGLWQAVVLGCAGARALDDGSFRLEPNLPAGWDRLRFRWIHRGTPLTVTVSRRRAARRGGRGGRLDHGPRLDGRGARGRAAPARRAAPAAGAPWPDIYSFFT